MPRWIFASLFSHPYAKAPNLMDEADTLATLLANAGSNARAT
jgi:hypothetical protein